MKLICKQFQPIIYVEHANKTNILLDIASTKSYNVNIVSQRIQRIL